MEHLFIVKGMSCGHCEKAVTQAIHTLDPKAEVTIERSAERVKVLSEQDPATLAQAIRDEGYSVS